MKKLILLLFLYLYAKCSYTQSLQEGNEKNDSINEVTRKKIDSILTKEINIGLDKIYVGGKDTYQYFTIRFKIVDYDKVKGYYTSINEKRISDTIISALNNSLQVLKREKLDFNVFEKIDLFMQVIVLYRENKDSGFDARIPVRNLSNHYYFIRDENLRPIGKAAPIFKCYQLEPIMYIRPEEKPSWREQK